MLSWEYPPVVYGGLGRHVHALAEQLAAAGHDVVVVTQHGGEQGTAYDEVRAGVRVVRAPADPPLVPFSDLLAWTMALGHGLARAALAVTRDWTPDVVHAHDWLVAHPAKTLKDATGAALVATVHATEAGRHQGWLPGPLNRAIHTVEWWLTYEARRVVTCSAYMRWEVTRLFDLPPEKVDVVANGIDVAAWRVPSRQSSARRRQLAGPGPLLVYAGRLEYEKGVQTLLAALPRLRRRHPGLRLAVAGDGTYAGALRESARRRRLGRSVRFLGRLASEELATLLAAADAAVVPSLYEPFGLVALEAAAVGTPLVVADTGGLRELVEPGRTGLRFPPGDAASLADALATLLSDDVLARRMLRAAGERAVREFGWSAVAQATAQTYAAAVRQERALQAKAPPLRIAVRDGNLLAGEAEV